MITPRFWSFRMFAALWGVLIAPLAPMSAYGQDDAAAAPIAHVSWSNVIGGDNEQILRALPALIRLADPIDQNSAQLALAIRLFELAGKGSGSLEVSRVALDSEGEPEFEFRATIDFEDRLPEVVELIGQISAWVGSEKTIEETEIAGTSFKRIGDAEVMWATVGSKLLFSSSEREAGELVERSTADANAVLKRVPDKIGANPDSDWHFSAYLDVGGTIDMVRLMLTEQGNLPPNYDKLMDGLGLNGLEAVYVYYEQADGGPVTRALLETDGSRKGILSLWDQQPLMRADLELLPKNAVWGIACNLDLAQLWRQARQTIETLDPNTAMQVDGVIGMSAAMLGFNIVDQVLPALGDTWVVYDAPEHGGFLITGIALVAEVDEPDALNAAVTRLLQFVNPLLLQQGIELTVRETDYRGHAIKYLSMPGLPIPIAPAAAYVDGRVVCGLSPQVVKVVLNQADPKLRTDSILNHEDVQKLVGDPSGKVQRFSYSDLKHNAKTGYGLIQLIRMMAVSLNEAGAEMTDIGQLPTLPEVLNQTTNSVAVCKVEGSDIKYEQKGSLFLMDAAFGDPLGAIYVNALMMSVLLPSLSRARALARRALVASNMRHIGLGAHIYANSHDGQFPENLDVLLAEGLITPEMLVSPRRPDDGVAYVYFGGQTDSSNPLNVLAYELVVGEDGTNVLFVDGHVEWLRPAEFERVLRESEERRERAKEDSGGGS